jgi:YVTN family beta-propeller protein
VRRHLLLALVGVAAAAAALWAGLPQERTVLLAYVASAGGNCVQVIDLASGEVARKIYAGATPWRLAVSPDGGRLWVQHWYSGTTAVIGLDNHEIIEVLPFRGPGAFVGGRFLTFDWPGSGLVSVDAATFARLEERVTEVPQVYDLAPAADGGTLYMVQFDPEARGPRPRYSYALSLPSEGEPGATPVSLRTGLSPVAVRALRKDPFLITADSGTNGLSLINHNGDGRAVPACPAPRAVILSADETRMAVACWRGEGARQSQVVVYRTHFGARPWPEITQTGTATVDGAVVAGSFSPAGDRLYLVDRTGGRLLEADPGTLKLLREIPVGDLPVDVAIAPVETRARDRLREKSRARQKVEAALARLREQGHPFRNLSWTEAVETRRLKAFLQPPDSFLLVTEEGSVRLAAGGDTVSIAPDGRFWVSPRQELISTVYALPGLAVDEAVRRLAGDVPGSPWLHAGIAVDIVADTAEVQGALLVGAPREGQRVSQLWIDAGSGRPERLLEQLPVLRAGGHGSEAEGMVETELHDWKQSGGVWMPSRLVRVLDGQLRQEVRIEDVAVDSGLPAGFFDLERLGGLGIRPKPGSVARTVPVLPHGYLAHPREPHPAYASDPPTSGPRLRSIADWGVHRLPVPPELQAHNLEHGGVLIQYNCPEPCPDLAAQLEEIARQRDFVLVAPYPRMDSRIALTAWGRIETLDDLDPERILRFVDAYAGRDHHEADGESPAGQLARAH